MMTQRAFLFHIKNSDVFSQTQFTYVFRIILEINSDLFLNMINELFFVFRKVCQF